MPIYINGNRRVQGTIEGIVGFVHPEMRYEDGKNAVIPFLIDDPKPLSFGAALKGAWEVIKASYNPPVSESVVRERAAVCSECPRILKTPSDCFGCGASQVLGTAASAVFSFINRPGSEEAKKHINKSCGVCECSLAVLLQPEIKNLDPEMISKPGRPQTCWMLL